MANIVDYDAYTGITETFSKDNGKITINQAKDVEPLMRQIKAERNANSSTFGKENYHKVATVDNVIIDMWREELKTKGHPDPNPLAAENRVWLIAKLNSRDFSGLKTKDVKI
jgi:hypothetical protein